MRRIGDEDMLVIEIVGKGDKIRRLPISESAIRAIDQYLSYRGLPSAISAPPDTPILNNLGVGRKSNKAGISRSGLYKALEKFFEGAAEIAQEHSATDAAKLRAGSTHWLGTRLQLRHSSIWTSTLCKTRWDTPRSAPPVGISRRRRLK